MKQYHRLVYEERCQIYALKSRGESLRSIAKLLNRDVSTISREIKRGSGQRGYRYKQAQALCEARKTSKSHKIEGSLKKLVIEKLLLQWSPMQIAGWLRRHEKATLSHECIYQFIWAEKRSGGSLYKNLRHTGKKYNKRSSHNAGRGCIPGRVDIDERPSIVDLKKRIGDFEIDTVIGANHKGAVVSIVDRASKWSRFIKVETKTASLVSEALITALEEYQPYVFTLTADNGKEFAHHKTVAKALQADIFFAKPYHSWQRGLNEHTNGLLRQYLPKKTTFTNLLQSSLDDIAKLLNNRPRASLNFQTPNEVFYAAFDSKSVALEH